MVKALKAAGANIAHAAMDYDGVVVENVEQRLNEFKAAGIRPKLIYLGVDFQTPTGTVMPVARREQLLAKRRRAHPGGVAGLVGQGKPPSHP